MVGALSGRRTRAQLRALDGRQATYVPLSLPPFPLDVIFERRHFEADLGVGIDGTNPVFTVDSELIDSIVQQGDQLVMDNTDLGRDPGTTTFEVKSWQPDGTGLTELECEEQE